MKKFFKEFSEFIKRGNVMDLAIGIVIGGAFQKIVSSLVNDVIMPLISIIGGVNVAEAKWVMKSAVTDSQDVLKPEIALTYGMFIQSVIDFLIIALAVFVGMKAVVRVGKRLAKARELLASEKKEESGTDTVESNKQSLWLDWIN